MEGLLIAAAALTVALASVHSILGERFIIQRLLRRPQPELFGSDDFTKRTLRFAWHVMTLFGYGLAAIMVWLAIHGPVAALVIILAATLTATAVLTIIISRGRHLSWVVELLITGLLVASL